MRLLIVEDYKPQRDALVRGLKQAGFAVDEAADGEQALWFAEKNDYDAVVLDLMIPKVDGWTVLTRLRDGSSPVPILLLSARDTVADRVQGLNGGADDYLTKPFEFEELLARLNALIRRRYGDEMSVVTVGDLTIDSTRRTAFRNGREILLTPREYALLEYLARRVGEVVSRSEIWEHIYEFHSGASSNVVDVYVGYLRRKLEDCGGARLIHTRRGHGYVMEEAS